MQTVRTYIKIVSVSEQLAYERLVCNLQTKEEST